ncbi:MAG: hypothetical protein NC122_03350 [Faecalibacterium sp.]|nr:hypothetical protein [Ruminococcus sp.]MCM1485222.1 hypothetical protein [Faecalibacterium sp.]
MFNTLYEYSLDITQLLWCLIPLVVGTAFFANSVVSVIRKNRAKGWDGCVMFFFKIVGFIVGPLCFILFVLMVAGTLSENSEYKQRIKTDDVSIVEGYVENFHPQSYEGHDDESFEIDGVQFVYSDFYIMNGYHKSASHGGVITHNGQYLKIKYIEEKLDGETNTVILYIAENSEKSIDTSDAEDS